MSIGVWQVILILVIVLIIFGAGKLPRVMGDLAKGIKNFKAGMAEPGKDEPDPAARDARTIEGEAGPVSSPGPQNDQAGNQAGNQESRKS